MGTAPLTRVEKASLKQGTRGAIIAYYSTEKRKPVSRKFRILVQRAAGGVRGILQEANSHDVERVSILGGGNGRGLILLLYYTGFRWGTV